VMPFAGPVEFRCSLSSALCLRPGRGHFRGLTWVGYVDRVICW
jgi:hypothetical protein